MKGQNRVGSLVRLRGIPLLAVFGLMALGSWIAAEAAPIAGTGSLSGTVQAPKPFKAAQVHAMNVDKNILFMVYTSGGRYQAVNMIPGNYEVRVQKRGFASDVQKVVISPGKNATVDFKLRDASAQSASGGAGFTGMQSGDAEEVLLVPYDELYPPDQDRALVEKTCVYCHGANFFPSGKRTQAAWRAAVEMMTTPNVKTRGGGERGRQIPAGVLSKSDMDKIAAYLGKHFGPDSKPRALLVEAEMPVDEQALSRAMYIEYYLPIDPQLDKATGRRRAQEPIIGLDGNLWYTDRIVPNRVGRLDPRTGEFKDYVLPDPKADPHGLVVDSEGYVFWAETRGKHLGRLNPKTGEMKRYPMDPNNEMPGGEGHTPVLDSKENVWFTMIIGNRVGKWDRKTEQIKTWEVPTENSFPYGILIDKNDKVWIAEFHGCKVAMFDPVTEKFTEYPALTLTNLKSGCTMRRLGMDQRTEMVYYGVFSHGKLGQIDVKTGEITEHTIPMPFSEPYDTWPDAQGNVWVSDGGQGGTLIKFEPKTAKMTYYPTPQRTDQPKLDISREGGIWYCPRSSTKAAVGVLYPDVTKMTTLAAYR